MSKGRQRPLFAVVAAGGLVIGCGRAGETGGSEAPPVAVADGGSFALDGGSAASPAALGDAGFCNGSGPIVTVGDSDGGASHASCTGQIAETTFKSALCACHDVNLQGYLRTRGFDSSKGGAPATADGGGAPVGINDAYVIPAAGANAGFTDVGGSFSVAGSTSIAFAGALGVAGDLRAAGSLTLAGYTRVARDAWIGGNVTNAGYATVGRDLHIGGTDMLPLVVQGARTQAPVAVPPPCACGPKDLLDIAALLAEGRAKNDDAAIGLSPGGLRDMIGYAEHTLPCGRYYVDEISGIGDLVLDVQGRVALFVGGSVKPTGNFEVRLAPGAEIDVFIGGTLLLTGRGAFGSADRPAATRLYVGGEDDVVLTGAGAFVGNLYAPRAKVRAVGYADVYGSLFVRDLEVPGYTSIAYDLAIGHAGDACDAPKPPTCTRCGTCTGGQACVNGACGTCTSDGDCCGQDVCDEGLCRPLVK